MSSARVAIADWLLSDEGRALGPCRVVAELGRRLNDAGVPVWRVHVGSRTKHPEVFARFYRWYEGHDEGAEYTRTHSEGAASVVDSPVAAVQASGGAPLRVPLEGPREGIPFELCRELKDEGATDYLTVGLVAFGGEPSIVSWATRRPGGFTEEHLEILGALVPTLRLWAELDVAHFVTTTLLRTYLGRNASARVLAGAFQRGAGERIDAAIWMSDLREFTKLVDTAPLGEVLTTLDTYFEAVAGAVLDHGGEVLKFIGDAVLAVFPLGEDPCGTCRRALDAAEDALGRMALANEARRGAGKDSLAFGMVLHRGEVIYGNIGTPGRLDFTVIGPAVNEASRVESLCKELKTPLLFTGAFAALANDARSISLGRHELRGVREALEIFTHAELRA
jgi:adenylate cyclase